MRAPKGLRSVAPRNDAGCPADAHHVEEGRDEPVHVASAYFVFVAIDEQGHPRPVPPLETETAGDVRRQREAEIRRAHRLARKTEIDQGREG